MNLDEIVERYVSLANDLEKIVADTESRVTGESADLFFITNANFLTKSFLISLCSYLEVFLKDVAHAHVSSVKQRLLQSKVPHNLLTWSVTRKVELKCPQFTNYDLSLTSKDIDDELSGNPFRTAKCFLLLGVNLEGEQKFVDFKERVNAIVAKRNNILHHNDTAGDVSLGDIRTYSNDFKAYIRAIASAVSAHN